MISMAIKLTSAVSPAGIRALSRRVGATKSGDLGGSSGGSQQDSHLGDQVSE